MEDSTTAENHFKLGEVSDLLVLILIRLPVKTLIKFLCISKSWYSLIKSPYFISSHLNHHLIHNPNHGLYSPHFNSQPLMKSVTGLSCNGLLLIYNNEYDEKSLSLWNPSIRNYMHLEPIPIPKYDYHPRLALGLGFDSFKNDYKVVAISYGHRPFNKGSTLPDFAQFYSINSGTWNNVSLPYSSDSENYFARISSEACFMNGVLHWISIPWWIGRINYDNASITSSLLTFDICKEGFGELRLPSELRVATQSLYITVIDNLLALLVYHFPSRESGLKYRVWLMKDYGVEESWIFLYDIQISRKCDPYNPKFWNDRAREEGDVFIPMCSRFSIFFNAKSQSSSTMDAQIVGYIVYALCYTQSLVFLDHNITPSKLQVEGLKRRK